MLVIMLMSAYLISENSYRANSAFDAAEAESIASNMIIYKGAASNYAEGNPAASGTISDSLLTLPSWFRKIDGVTNYVAGGKAYVYYVGMPEITNVLLKKTEAATVGVNRSGFLYSPSYGLSAIVIPAAIPDGAVVYAQ